LDFPIALPAQTPGDPLLAREHFFGSSSGFTINVSGWPPPANPFGLE
jgi:hypothetical protein